MTFRGDYVIFEEAENQDCHLVEYLPEQVKGLLHLITDWDKASKVSTCMSKHLHGGICGALPYSIASSRGDLFVVYLIPQSCLTLLRPHELESVWFICLLDFPGKNTATS